MLDGEHSRADYVDPETAVRQLELRLDVTRRAVESYFGDFSCNCTAFSSRGETTSPSVNITVACEYSLWQRSCVQSPTVTLSKQMRNSLADFTFTRHCSVDQKGILFGKYN